MGRKYRFVVGVTIALCCEGHVSAEPHVAPVAVDARQGGRPLWESIVFPPATRVALKIPPPLAIDDLVEIARLIDLSPAQLTFARARFEDYCREYIQLSEDEFPRLQTLADAVAHGSVARSWAQLDVIRQFYEHQRHIARVTNSLDEKWFSLLATVLNEDQYEGLDRARSFRARGRCGWVDRDILGARIDLTRLVREHAPDELGSPLVDAVLSEYEGQATPLFVSLNDEIMRQLERIAEANVSRWMSPDGREYTPGSDESVQHDRAGRTRIHGILLNSADLQVRLAQTNELYLSRLTASIADPAVGETIQRNYKRLAFPAIHPDPNDASTLLERLAQDRRLPEHVRQAIVDMRDDFEKRHAAITADLERENLHWMTQMAKTRAAAGQIEYVALMRQLREDRLKLNEQTSRIAFDLVSPDLRGAYEPMFDEIKASIVSSKQTWAEDRFP